MRSMIIKSTDTPMIKMLMAERTPLITESLLLQASEREPE